MASVLDQDVQMPLRDIQITSVVPRPPALQRNTGFHPALGARSSRVDCSPDVHGPCWGPSSRAVTLPAAMAPVGTELQRGDVLHPITGSTADVSSGTPRLLTGSPRPNGAASLSRPQAALAAATAQLTACVCWFAQKHH